MSWKCTTPTGREVILEDLPIKTLERIANEAGLSAGAWYSLPQQPALHAGAAVSLLRACCELVGEDAPDDSYLTARNALEVFQRMESDDRAIEHSDGLPVVDPKEDTAEAQTS